MVSGLPLSARNLILTGYRETNKPRVGLLVAEKLGMPFVDVDAQIEERIAGFSNESRSDLGERRLKTIEDDVLEDVSLYRSAVIRIAGSSLIRGDHLKTVQRSGIVVCLVARMDAILARLHLTMGARYHNPADRAVAIGELEREWAIRRYENILELDVTDDDEPTTIDAVVALWRKIGIERG